MTKSISGCVLTPNGWVRGTLRFDTRIATLEGRSVAAPEAGEARILPGFIDLHVHGGGGRDVMEGGDAIDVIARLHASHGTTSLLATTMTDTRQRIEHALTGIRRVIDARPAGTSRVLGVHLEGPFISARRLGAQPPETRPGTLDEVFDLHRLATIRVLTLAPETPGHLELIAALSAAGIRPQLGHSAGSYEEGVEALDAGAAGFTHLFNAMTAFHHREPGMVGAALAHADYAEVIPDLLHVHPGAIKAACRAIPHVYCVTDSTAGAGMPDGNYFLGTQPVTKCLGGIRLADGTLAGSILTMDQALRNLVSIGLPLEDAARRTSTFPADYLGESERGRLQPGAWADIVVLDDALCLTDVFVEGESIEPAPATH